MPIKELTVETSKFDIDSYIKSIDNLCKALDYKPIGKCSCKETSNFYLDEIQIGRNKIKLEKVITERVDCLHYGTKIGPFHKKEKEGVILVVESFKEDIVKTAIETLYGVEDTKFKTISTDYIGPEQVGVIRCYGYGSRCEGEDVKIESVFPKFECCSKLVELPPTLKILKLKEKNLE